MKWLIIVRHGHYTGEGNDQIPLSSEGRNQMRRLAEKLDAFINNNIPLILSSPAVRAIESAALLAEPYKTGIEMHEVLLSQYGRFDREGILKLLERKAPEHKAIVLVTHLEVGRDFPHYFGEQWLKRNIPGGEELRNGTALYINCQSGGVIPIS